MGARHPCTGTTESWLKRRLLLLAGLALIPISAMMPTTAIGQGDGAEASPLVPAGLAATAQGIVSVPFSVAGPVSPTDERLTLLAVKRSCGAQFESADAMRRHPKSGDRRLGLVQGGCQGGARWAGMRR